MFRLSYKQLFFWSGLLAIIIVYSVYNIFLVDASYYFFIPRIIRHISGLVCVLIVYGIGTYALKKYTVGWMMQIWHLLHVFLILLLLLISILAWGWAPLPYQLHNIASALHEFLISPVLYVAMGIINSRLAI